MKFVISIFFALLILSYGCKKNNNNVVESPPPNAVNTNTISVYSGFFQSFANTEWTGSTPTTDPYIINVYLQSSPTATPDIMFGINSGTLSVNSIKLKYEFFKYFDTTSINSTASKNFQLQSSGIIPSFNFNNTDTFPGFYYNFNNVVNDTLSKASNYIIPLNGFTYPDEIYCELFYGNDFIEKKVPNGTNQVIFTPSELSVFPVGVNVTLLIDLRKYNAHTVNNKVFKFENRNFSTFNVYVDQ